MNDKILQFPGGTARKPAAPQAAPVPVEVPEMTPEHLAQAQALLGNLSPDQQKALQVVMSGMPFVCVGIKPTPSGADFFTALHGEPADLRNAQSHLASVIERAYARKGI